MTLSPSSGPNLGKETLADVRELGRQFVHRFAAHRRFALAMLLLAAALLTGILPYDERLLATIHFWHREPEKIAHRLAYELGTWGDFPTYNLPLVVLLWIYGFATGSRRWRRIAWICLLGAGAAGLCADCFRLTVGRARPDSHILDGFYGLAYAWRGGYQSFPSGHSASVLGAAVALLLVCRPLGWITLVYGLAVCWARMELNKHYPSDVAVGMVIGVTFGLMAGWAGRGLLAEK